MKTIFVSSTFKDFQEERDMLRSDILPLLNEKAKAYGESVSFCDLRWGIDTSDEDEAAGSSKVLDVCLDEIDRSHPYFIVLLGDRYGYMPGSAAISREAGRKQILLKDTDISVTALEVEYGLWRCGGDDSHLLFYFRKIKNTGGKPLPTEFCTEDLHHAKKRQSLIEEIRNKTGASRIRSYEASWDGSTITGLSSFSELVKSDLTEILQKEWKEKENLHLYEKENIAQWNYIQEKDAPFCAREKFSDEIAGRLLLASGDRLLAVTGDAGIGKSTLFSHICNSLKSKGCTVLPVLCGITSVTTTALGILEYLVWQLEFLNGSVHQQDSVRTGVHSDAKILRSRLNTLCADFTKDGRKLVVAVDALDQLMSDDLQENLTFLPDVIPKKVQVFVTCFSGYKLPGTASVIPLSLLQGEDILLVIRNILKLHGKELPDAVQDVLVRKEDAGNPLYLYLLTARLMLLNSEDYRRIRENGDGMEAISAYMCRIVQDLPGTAGEMGCTLIREISRHLKNENVFEEACLLAGSRHGLRISDLEAILAAEGKKFSLLSFAQFVHYISELFFRRDDGRFDFMHKSLREGLEAAYCTDNNTAKKLFLHFSALDPEDSVRINEYTWHCIRAEEYWKLFAYINNTAIKSASKSEAAARDVYGQMLTDHGEFVLNWISNIHDHVPKNNLAVLLYFFNTYIYRERIYMAGGTSVNLPVMKKVYETLLTLFRGKSDAPLFELCFAESLEDLGNITLETGGEGSWEEAGIYYTEFIALLEKNRENLNLINSLSENEAYARVGYYYEIGKGRENAEKAASFYKKEYEAAMALREKDTGPDGLISSGLAKNNLAKSLLAAGGRENLRQGLKLSCEAFQEEEHLSYTLTDDFYRHECAQYALEVFTEIFQTVWQLKELCEEVPEKQEYDILLAPYMAASIALADRLNREYHTEKARLAVCNTYGFASAYYYAGKNNDKALFYGKKRADGMEAMGRDYGTESYQGEFRSILEAFKRSDKPAGKYPSAEDNKKRALSDGYAKQALNIRETKDKGNFKLGLQLCEESLEISEDLYNRYGNPDSRTEYAAALRRIINYLETFGGFSNNHSAKKYRKRLESLSSGQPQNP